MATTAWLDCRTAGDGPDADIPSAATSVITRPVVGCAVRLTRHNRPEVATWVRGEGGRALPHPGGLAILNPGQQRPMVASPGDHVVLVGGAFVVVGELAYRGVFTPG